MSSSAGLPQTPEQRPPLRRGVREAIIALAALPVLLAAGVYVGGRIADSGPASLQPATPVAGDVRTPTPVVTVRPATPRSVVTVRPAAPSPVVTVKPPALSAGPVAPSPVVTVRPPAAAPLVTVKPAAPAPLVTVKPAAPAPLVSVQPPGPTTSATSPSPFPPVSTAPGAPPPVVGPVSPTRPPAAPRLVLGPGSTGADVRAWQGQMARRHWQIEVDGIFGPQTERVARRFQRIKGLQIDGLVGRETWDAAWTRPVVL